MIEKKNPFSGLNNHQIAALLKANKRPPLKKTDTPAPLINLLNMCWDPDPIKRPTSKEVYQMFADGTVYFAGTDKKAVKKLVDTLEAESHRAKPTAGSLKKKRRVTKDAAATSHAYERKLEAWAEACRNEDDLRRAYDLPMPSEVRRDRSTAIVRTPQEREEAEIRARERMLKLSKFKGEETPITVEANVSLSSVLKSPNDARFKSAVTESIELINEDNCAAFCAAMINAILHAEDNTVPEHVVSVCTELIYRNKKFVPIFANGHLFEALPTDTMPQKDASLGFIGAVVSVAPNQAGTSLTRALSSLIKSIPAPALELFVVYATKFDVIHFPGSFVEVFLQYARVYLEADDAISARYLHVIFMLMKNPKFSNFMDITRPIISAFACSKSDVIAKLAIRIMTHFYDSEFIVPYNSVLHLLEDKSTSEDALALLLRVEKLPVSQRLYKAITLRAVRSHRAILVLLKYALQQPETTLICSSHPRWLQSESPSTLKVLLAVFAEELPKNRIVQTRDFANFLTRTVKTAPIDSANAAKALFRGINLSQTIIDRLTRSGYIAALAEVFKTADVQTSTNIMFGLDAMARAGYSSDYKYYFDRLARMLNPPNKQTKLAAHVLSTLSSHTNIAKIFKASGLKGFFEKASSSLVIPNDAEIFLHNISAV